MDEVKDALADSINAFHDFAVDEGARINVGLVEYDSNLNPTSIADISSVAVRNNLLNILSMYSAGGSTATAAGIKMAKDMLVDYDSDRKIIVLLSDGAPKSKTNSTNQATIAKNLGIQIFTIAYTTNADLSKLMCSWSSDNETNCNSGNYSFESTSSSGPYQAIVDTIKGKPGNNVLVWLNGVSNSVNFSTNSDFTSASLNLSSVLCQSNSQSLPMSVTGFTWGNVTISNIQVEYCEACQ
jgi:hypothetical protein